MINNLGTLVSQPTQEILDFFTPVEGQNALYFGKIRNGKTYAATADIISLLKRGEIVYANWQINFDDYDERDHLFPSLMKFLAFKKYYYKFSKENFHYFDPDNIDVPLLGRLVNVHVFIDEGQWLFNSHVREKADDPIAIEKRKLILHGGHYCRSLNVITQRSTNVFPDIRSQINVWYYCEKKFSLGRINIFQRSEIQNMVGNEPDMEAIEHTKVYFGKKEIYNAYNTHAMRGDDAIEMQPIYEVYALTGSDRLNLLLAFVPFVGRFIRRRKHKAIKQLRMTVEEYPRTFKGFIAYALGLRVKPRIAAQMKDKMDWTSLRPKGKSEPESPDLI